MAGYHVNGVPLMLHELADERVQWFQKNGNRQQRLEAAEILRERQARAQAWEAYRQTPGYLVDQHIARPFPKAKNNLGVLAESVNEISRKLGPPRDINEIMRKLPK
jgi:hypothetical protein